MGIYSQIWKEKKITSFSILKGDHQGPMVKLDFFP